MSKVQLSLSFDADRAGRFQRIAKEQRRPLSRVIEECVIAGERREQEIAALRADLRMAAEILDRHVR